MAMVNRLTVDGRDYILSAPIDGLRDRILAAIRAGGDYVTIPGPGDSPGVDILFSPGVTVTWAQIDVDAEADADADDDSPTHHDHYGI